MEKEGEKEGVSRDKDRRKEEDRMKKTAAKVSFLRRYYPDAHSSPGGSVKMMKQRHTDINSDRETGDTGQSNLETSSRCRNSPSFPLQKRKTENLHTDDLFFSPSKKPKLSTFTKKLQFWSSMDPHSGSDIAEPSGVLKWKPEGQEKGGKL